MPTSEYELVQASELSFTDFSKELTDCDGEIWIAIKKK
ncbi:conserved hypothetical protein [Enterococcus faecium E1679]|nr:conserved hypothetical protein [Enterococcus faecium E1679]